MAPGIKAQKQRKGISIGKEEVYFSLFADDMILYIENPKDSIIKFLELISEYGKIAGYKINTQRSQDGRGIGRADHFLPYKFIERTIER